MKKYMLLLFSAFAAGFVFAQPIGQPHKWTITIQVTDESGVPVSDAKVSVGYYTNSTPASIDGLTDTNGIFVAAHNDVTTFLGHDMGFVAGKSGYYQTWVRYDLGPGYVASKWNLTTNLVLKKIVNPIPMYARWVRSEPPIFKKWGRPPIAFTNSAGYDFVVGDWVAPYGKGAHTDIIFKEEFNKKSFRNIYYKLIVSFPNKGDGIRPFTPSEADKACAKAGGLLSSYEAPAEDYQPILAENQSGNPNRDYYFRVRTVLDENGNIKSALYGKIYGDFMNFSYYLDPTPNDRNVEFDPGHSLLSGVPSFDQVTKP